MNLSSWDNKRSQYDFKIFDKIAKVLKMVGKWDSQSVKQEHLGKIQKLSGYLKQYDSVLKLTQRSLNELEAKKEAEISQISNLFERLRKEMDMRETLLKQQYSVKIDSIQALLDMDYGILSRKWGKLCEDLDYVMAKASNFPQPPNS